MLSPLRNETFRRLFAAQVLALVGAGLATVALALLAYDMAGGDAGLVVATALALKMAAYVVIAPLAGALADRVPRRAWLAGLDVIRAGAVALLPFVDAIWQIYALILILQSASAAFTPIFQATIADIIEDEREYTAALSLSRLAYDLEAMLSPALTALLLTLVSFHWLFGGTALGFALSAILVLSVALRRSAGADANSDTRAGGSVWSRTLAGLRDYLSLRPLRGLLAVSWVAATAGAMVIVNTVVIARETLGGSDATVALAMAVFGAGSMGAALALPRLLERFEARSVMVSAAAAATLVLAGMGWAVSGAVELSWALISVAWFALGACYAAILTPSGRLIRGAAGGEARTRLFAAQFALSHACWLATYPLAGWLGATGLAMMAQAGGSAEPSSGGAWSLAFLGLAGASALGTGAALLLWPHDEGRTRPVPHVHADLPADHPHLADAERAEGGYRHAHQPVADPLHPAWARPG